MQTALTMFQHYFHFSSFLRWQMNNCNLFSPCFRLVSDRRALRATAFERWLRYDVMNLKIRKISLQLRLAAFGSCYYFAAAAAAAVSVVDVDVVVVFLFFNNSDTLIRIHWNWFDVRRVCCCGWSGLCCMCLCLLDVAELRAPKTFYSTLYLNRVLKTKLSFQVFRARLSWCQFNKQFIVINVSVFI